MATIKNNKAFFAFLLGIFIPLFVFISAQLPSVSNKTATQVSAAAAPLPVDLDLTHRVTKTMLNGTFQNLLMQIMDVSSTSFGYSKTNFLDAFLVENGYPTSGDALNQYISVGPAQAKSKLTYAYLRQALPYIGGELVNAGMLDPDQMSGVTWWNYTWDEQKKALIGLSQTLEAAILNYTFTHEQMTTLIESGSFSSDEVAAVINDILTPSAVELISKNAVILTVFGDLLPNSGQVNYASLIPEIEAALPFLEQLIQESMTAEEAFKRVCTSSGSKKDGDYDVTCVNNILYTGVSELLPALNDFYGYGETNFCPPCGKECSEEEKACKSGPKWYPAQMFGIVRVMDPYPYYCRKSDITCEVNPDTLKPPLSFFGQPFITVEPSVFYDIATSTYPVSEARALNDTMLYFQPSSQVIDFEKAVGDFYKSYLATPAGETFMQNLKNLSINNVVADPETVMTEGSTAALTQWLSDQMLVQATPLLASDDTATAISGMVDESVELFTGGAVEGYLTSSAVETLYGGPVPDSKVTAVQDAVILDVQTNAVPAIDVIKANVLANIDANDLVSAAMATDAMNEMSIRIAEEYALLVENYAKSDPEISALITSGTVEPDTMVPLLESKLQEAGTLEALMEEAVMNVVANDAGLPSDYFYQTMITAVDEALQNMIVSGVYDEFTVAFGDINNYDPLGVQDKTLVAIGNIIPTGAGGVDMVEGLTATATIDNVSLTSVSSVMSLTGAASTSDIEIMAPELSTLGENDTAQLVVLADALNITNVDEVKSLANILITNDIQDIDGLAVLAQELNITGLTSITTLVSDINKVSAIGTLTDIEGIAALTNQFDITSSPELAAALTTINDVKDLSTLSDIEGVALIADTIGLTGTADYLSMLPNIISLDLSDPAYINDLSSNLGISTLLPYQDQIAELKKLQNLDFTKPESVTILGTYLGLTPSATYIKAITGLEKLKTIDLDDPEVATVAVVGGLLYLAGYDESDIPNYDDQIIKLKEIQNLDLSKEAAVNTLSNKLGIPDIGLYTNALASIDTLQNTNLTDPGNVSSLASQLGYDGAATVLDKAASLQAVADMNLSDPAGYAAAASQFGFTDTATFLSDFANPIATLTNPPTDIGGYAALASSLGYTDASAFMTQLVGPAQALATPPTDLAGYAAAATQFGYTDAGAFLNEFVGPMQLLDNPPTDVAGYAAVANSLGYTDASTFVTNLVGPAQLLATPPTDLAGYAAAATQFGYTDAGAFLNEFVGPMQLLDNPPTDVAGYAAAATQFGFTDAGAFLNDFVTPLDALTNPPTDVAGWVSLGSSVGITTPSGVVGMLGDIEALGTIDLSNVNDAQGLSNVITTLNQNSITSGAVEIIGSSGLMDVLGPIVAIQSLENVEDFSGLQAVIVASGVNADEFIGDGFSDVLGDLVALEQIDGIEDLGTLVNLAGQYNIPLGSAGPYLEGLGQIATLLEGDISASSLLTASVQMGYVSLTPVTTYINDFTASIGVDLPVSNVAMLAVITALLEGGSLDEMLKSAITGYIVGAVAALFGPLAFFIDFGGLSAAIGGAFEILEGGPEAMLDATIQAVYMAIQLGGLIGGQMGFVQECDCSKGAVIFSAFTVPVVAPLPGMDLWVNPGKSKVYPYSGVNSYEWVLGEFEIDVLTTAATAQACWKKTKYACSLVPSLGQITIIGTG